KWKQAFDSDPLDRAGSGVRRYRIMRAANNELDLTIDLMFKEVQQAEQMAQRRRELWRRPEVANLLGGPTAEAGAGGRDGVALKPVPETVSTWPTNSVRRHA